MASKVDLTGQDFGLWHVESEASRIGKRKSFWSCTCRCGTKKDVRADHLLANLSSSCGCLHIKKLALRQTKHGKHGSLEYCSWDHMKQRCNNPNNTHYKHYGQRGIKVCSQWDDSATGFQQFLKDMGERPTPKHTLERLDVNGDYCPDNCVWALSKAQGRNRRNNKLLEAQGKVQPLSAWAEELGYKVNAIDGWLGYEPSRTLEDYITYRNEKRAA